MPEKRKEGVRGPMAELYNVFIDWKGRLGRELPGLLQSLRAVDAQRVLDAGCGTGRHLAALLENGFEAVGADVSEAMLAQARELVGPERIFEWRIGDEPPPALMDAAPFDAITCLGNTWPQIREPQAIRDGAAGFRRLLRPGGLLLVGLKAVEIRREQKNPYIPLLRREHEGRALHFIRFVDFDVAPEVAAQRLCDFHMVIARGDADDEEPDVVEHRVGRWRVWSPPELEETFRAAGFADVRVSASLGDPNIPPETEDVFVHALAASG